MSDPAPDLDPEEWLLHRLHPKHGLSPVGDGRFRPSSASFSPHSANGGVSFNRESTLRQHGRPLWEGCPDDSWAVAAIQVKDLIALGLKVCPTPPPPHHVDAFGLSELGSASEKRLRKRIAEACRTAVWPGWIETWPPTDTAPAVMRD